MRKVSIENIYHVAKLILTKANVPEDEASVIAATVVDAHKCEKHTHGLNRLPIYIRKIDENLMTAHTEMAPVKDSPIITVFDIHHGFGHVAMEKSAFLCIDAAKKQGVKIIGIRNSNNFGAAGYYGKILTDHGMIGIIFGNSAPAIAPTGASKAVLGTNPICFAFPTERKENPIILDMAVSVAARGKIRLAARNGEKIPSNWALGNDGSPTSDPLEALKGSLLPIGGYKGYGLALAVDIIAGLLTGSAFGNDVNPLNHPDAYSRHGHFMIALNPAFFMPEDEYKHKISKLVSEIKSTGSNILLPGEQSNQNRLKNSESVFLKKTQIDDTNALAQQLDISARLTPLSYENK